MSAVAFSRLNFLYQAIEELVSSGIEGKLALIHSYCKSFAQIAEKKVLRLDPTIRRRICKKCVILLIPGVTAIVRHRSKRQKHKVVTCQLCGTMRKYYDLSGKSFSIESNTATGNG